MDILHHFGPIYSFQPALIYNNGLNTNSPHALNRLCPSNSAWLREAKSNYYLISSARDCNPKSIRLEPMFRHSPKQLINTSLILEKHSTSSISKNNIPKFSEK
jgi:hypothetical protein